MATEGPRRLLLVRHGRTAWNAEGRAQGHLDVDLDEVGRAQARAMAEAVAAYRPTHLATSDLARARQTAAYVERACGLIAVADPRLREYDVGERSGLTLSEFARQQGRDPDAWDPHEHVLVRGAESTEQVAARMVPALQGLVTRLAPGETGVVVVHGAALRVGLAGVLGWPLEAAGSLQTMDNCAWAVLVESHRGGRRLAAYNLAAAAPARPRSRGIVATTGPATGGGTPD